MKKIRVLICDDSALMRRTLKKIVESDPAMEVAGTARDGEDAVIKARELRPDVVTMDVNMPGMDGITALQIITDERIAPVIMVSALTQEGAEPTFEAMALGAFDYVPKPGGTITVNMGAAALEIRRKVKAAAGPRVMENLTRRTREEGRAARQAEPSAEDPGARPARRLPPKPVRGSTGTPASKASASATPSCGAPARRSALIRGPGFKGVAIGVSTGGPKTLFEVLPFLPADLNAAVFLVQHMPPAFITSYARRIDAHCPMRCIEAGIGMIVAPGTIYLAGGGLHMIVYQRSDGRMIIRTPRRPPLPFTPSIDVMMASVAEVFGQDAVGVLMTGMGDDGANSMVTIVRSGGITIAESQESAIVFGMPAEAIARGGAHLVLPSWDIAEAIVRAVNEEEPKVN